MQADPVDPRDLTWESDEPAYRVYFWQRLSATGWASDEWRVTGADVVEVLAWAEEQARGRYVTIGVEVDDRADGLGLVRLHGWQPTSATAPPDHVEAAGAG